MPQGASQMLSYRSQPTRLLSVRRSAGSPSLKLGRSVPSEEDAQPFNREDMPRRAGSCLSSQTLAGGRSRFASCSSGLGVWVSGKSRPAAAVTFRPRYLGVGCGCCRFGAGGACLAAFGFEYLVSPGGLTRQDSCLHRSRLWGVTGHSKLIRIVPFSAEAWNFMERKIRSGPCMYGVVRLQLCISTHFP